MITGRREGEHGGETKGWERAVGAEVRRTQLDILWQAKYKTVVF